MTKRAFEAAVKRYGIATIMEAYKLHTEEGMGASTVSCYLGRVLKNTNAADSAINAGRYLHNDAAAQSKYATA